MSRTGSDPGLAEVRRSNLRKARAARVFGPAEDRELHRELGANGFHGQYREVDEATPALTEEEKFRRLAEAVVVFNAQLALGRKRLAVKDDADGSPEKAWDWLRDRKRSEWWCRAAGVRWDAVVDAVGDKLDRGKD